MSWLHTDNMVSSLEFLKTRKDRKRYFSGLNNSSNLSYFAIATLSSMVNTKEYTAELKTPNVVILLCSF